MSNVTVLCIGGAGLRTQEDYESFRRGLRRQFSPATDEALDVHFSDHHDRLDVGPEGSWPRQDLPTYAPRDPAGADVCVCCHPGRTYRWYAATLRAAPSADLALRQMAEMKLRDVRTYLASPPDRQHAIWRVANQIRQLRPQVLIGHSLGTALLVEALALALQPGEGPGVSTGRAPAPVPEHIVTAGAPFAHPRFMGAWSEPALAFLREPGCPWLNLVDISDEVTRGGLPPREVYPATTDVVVDNDGIVNRIYDLQRSFTGPRAGISSNHQVENYLSHEAFRDWCVSRGFPGT